MTFVWIVLALTAIFVPPVGVPLLLGWMAFRIVDWGQALIRAYWQEKKEQKEHKQCQ